MSRTSRLRASCERCRQQKLRCLPSSDPESTAPCQRCVKAKVPESCVFRSRSRSQRPTQAATASDKALCHKDLDIELAVPGMNMFALCSPFSSTIGVEASDVDQSSSPTLLQNASQASEIFSLDECRPQSSDYMFSEMNPGPWKHVSGETFPQQYTWDESLFTNGNEQPGPRHTRTANSHSITHSTDSSTRTEAHEAFSSSLSDWAADILPGDREIRVEDSSTKERSDPVVDLTNLLAEMSSYDRQMSRMSVEGIPEIAHYPVGDALSFSREFCTILSSNSKPRQRATISNLDTPTILVVLSCFMTLNRIYSAIFRHLMESLSRVSTTHTTSKGSADFRSYRGLRLNQLHRVCPRSEGRLIKNAVSMLLESLGSAEDILDLPSDVRVTSVSKRKSQRVQDLTLGRDNGQEILTSGQGSLSMIRSGIIDNTIGLQTEELRKEVKQLVELLNKAPGDYPPH
jgi:hypothetical protein